MLAGFAIEALLKAKLITREGTINDKGRFTRDSHDLSKLAAMVGYMRSHRESELFERLGEYLIWAGRYPVAKTSQPMHPKATSEEFAPRTFHIDGIDWPAIRSLFTRLKDGPPHVP